MEIPADGILLESVEITTDESAMTGETDPMKKSILADCLKVKNEVIKNNGEKTVHSVPSPMLLSGTTVLSGEGKCIILAVGD
jgi:magnesium-transporting ATPase (P-type)